MSARKRHTSMLDAMRYFMANERALVGWDNNIGVSWREWGEEVIPKLLKRGWIARTRSPARATGSFRPIMQRRNSLRSTAKGRRAVYAADRNAAPQMRKHRWTSRWGGWRMKSILEAEARDEIKLTRLSVRVRDLHGSRTA